LRWERTWDDYAVTTVRYDLEPTATGTRLRVTHTGFADRDMAAAGTGEGWKRVLQWLAAHNRARQEAQGLDVRMRRADCFDVRQAFSGNDHEADQGKNGRILPNGS